jgi:phage baseplate assembly protein W
MNANGGNPILGSGLAFPLGVDARGAVALAREETDVEQAIGVILSTARGERPMRPEFGCGIHDYVFERVDAFAVGRMEHAIRVALERWEPRIEVLSVRFDLAEISDGRLVVEIEYRILATTDKRNLVYPFYVIPAEERA